MSSEKVTSSVHGDKITDADVGVLDCNSYVKTENEDDTGQDRKNPELPSLVEQQTTSNSGSHFKPSVIIVQNSSNLNFDDLEPSILKCVKQVLANTEGQHSLMIVNEGQDGGEPSDQQTTYIIDLDSFEKEADNFRETQCESSLHGDLANSGLPEMVRSSTGKSEVDTLETTPTQHSKHTKDSVNEETSPMAIQEQVEISFVTCPSQMDINNPSSDAEVSLEIVCSQSESSPVSQTSHTYTHEPEQVTENTQMTQNLLGASKTCRSLSQKPSDTSNVSSYSFTSSPSSQPSSIKTKTSAHKTFPEKESHISLEHLLQMAKTIIEDKTRSKKPVLGQLSNDTGVKSTIVEVPEKENSERIVTMYLSLPEDMKEKMKIIDPTSAIVTVRADDDSSVDDNETKDTGSVSSDSSQRTMFQKSGEINADASNSSEKVTDSFVSISPSASASGVVYRCSECGYCSHNKHYYKQHVDLVHNEDRPYKCPHCDYAGKRRHALLEHLVVHSNQRPFTCDHCNASFRKKGHLTNHIKLHTSQRLVHCGVCNIQLPDADAFESHLHKIHNTDKLYKCRLCDHTVVDKDVMLKHLHDHNEAIMFSCPKCPSLFKDEESLITHLNGNHHFSFEQNTNQKPCETGNACMRESASVPQPASIICSECGFVCKDTEMMQKHMWVHIKSEEKNNTQTNDKIKIYPVNKEEGTSNFGVLKMNVDLGQKTLPKDVVYQCSSCSFTSSDNSVFIKHMLAHKTQEKRQLTDLSGLSKFSAEDNQVLQMQPATSAQSVFKPVRYYSSLNTDRSSKSDSGVPFIYDKASARFRCVICGYHCEFQRTIKAHIWKHSGHQSIEYPTFDHLSTTKNSAYSPVIQVLSNKDIKQMDGATHAGANSAAANASDIALSHILPVLRTRSGETVKLVPVNPLETNYNPGDLVQIKNNSVIVPAESGRPSAASQFLESVAFSHHLPDDMRFKDKDFVHPSSTGTVTTHNDERLKEEHFVKLSNTLSRPSTGQGLSKKLNSSANLSSRLEISEQDDTRSSCDVDETEPSVVVEVVDTVPSGCGLTGMKSQQGSPRIPDIDLCSGEVTLSKTVGTLAGRRYSSDSDVSSSSGSDILTLDGNDRTSYVQAVNPLKNHHSYSAKLRCPTCDCLVTEDFKTHLLSCQKKSGDDIKFSKLKSACEGDQKVHAKNPDDAENLRTEDTDSIESSDELANSGSFAGQQKSGICSSLLAVIEQLRERSRSESEEDKHGPQASKKGGKKKPRQVEEAELISIEDLQNIEKITDNGSDKFRCCLCHYSSHRICNIKLHMKTHRQKKPSECSLCDFSSTSPEALQEHMLKHCKVRTYPCKFCPQSFNHKSTLRAHLRAHKDQEPFLCAYCVFETTNPMEYREHMQVHSGCSSRLRCPGCDLILSNKEELTAHLLMCKGSARKSRPIMDKIVKTEVNIEQEYDKMEQKSVLDPSSTSHACVVSGCSFSSSNLKELQDHLSVHCNPSLLVCNLCDFKALHSRSLKSHMKRHANDQRYVQQPLEQYKCNLCGYVCHHLPSLKSHMWRHASDQSYSYEFTNDVINAAIDHDTRVDADGEADDPELLDRVINSERKILEGELTKFSKGDGQRPICWVTFRCCSCGFETINKAKLNIHMRSHSDIIQKALDVPRKSGNLHNKAVLSPHPAVKFTGKRANISSSLPGVPLKVFKKEETFPI